MAHRKKQKSRYQQTAFLLLHVFCFKTTKKYIHLKWTASPMVTKLAPVCELKKKFVIAMTESCVAQT